MGVMVVMPSFSEGKQCNPEAVSGGVCGLVSPRAPHVGGGVNQPGGVEIQDRAEEDAPKENGPSAEHEKNSSEKGHGNPVPSAEPDVEFVFAKVGDVREEDGRVVVNALAGEDPADVGP